MRGAIAGALAVVVFAVAGGCGAGPGHGNRESTNGVSSSPSMGSSSPDASQVICDGNSMTVGHPDDLGPTSYPRQLHVLLGDKWLVWNLGVDSQDTGAMSADAGTQIDGLCSKTRHLNVVVCWEGTNDICMDDTGGATAFERLSAYCTARQKVGFKVVMCTILPRSRDTTPADFETQRQVCNAAIRANWKTCADGLADLAADHRIGDAGDEADTAYFMDGVHLTAAGNAIVAQIVKSEVEKLK